MWSLGLVIFFYLFMKRIGKQFLASVAVFEIDESAEG